MCIGPYKLVWPHDYLSLALTLFDGTCNVPSVKNLHSFYSTKALSSRGNLQPTQAATRLDLILFSFVLIHSQADSSLVLAKMGTSNARLTFLPAQ